MGITEIGEMNGPIPRLSVVIPCFNERDNIQKCVEGIAEALLTEQIPYEILVVNDGSSDDTLAQARSLMLSNSSVRVIDLGENCGKTVALREGVRRTRGEIVAFFDADLQYSPQDLVTMIARLSDTVDFVNGTRDYNGYGASRTAFSRLYNRVVRLLFRMELRDSNCGIKVLRRKAADADTIFNYGLPLVVPLLKIRGFESCEVPVVLHERKNGESKYFQDGQFLGGSKNIRDITYHSIMLLNLIAHAPLESLRQRITRDQA
ncbi:MAG TPA: glycosyltransferase family 2 protein [Candidatus Dormibacteraeota bacterium]|nr:glycosyltransferase family 2 protein [Candidatus Dormibacteraeota bacterium]